MVEEVVCVVVVVKAEVIYMAVVEFVEVVCSDNDSGSGGGMLGGNSKSLFTVFFLPITIIYIIF